MRIAAVQLDIAIGETRQNLEKILSRMNEAAQNKAGLVIFPECSLQGYCFATREEAWAVGEELSGAACARLADETRNSDVPPSSGFSSGRVKVFSTRH
jgi:Predicted amidohydrolase